jgi:hypothetical protein
MSVFISLQNTLHSEISLPPPLQNTLLVKDIGFPFRNFLAHQKRHNSVLFTLASSVAFESTVNACLVNMKTISAFVMAILASAVEVSIAQTLDHNMTVGNDSNHTFTDELMEDCQAALIALESKPALALVSSAFAQDLSNACNNLDSEMETCAIDVEFLSTTATVNACSLESYTAYQFACKAAGGQFCSMVGTATGDISLLGGLFKYAIDISLECVATCIPADCSPEDLEDQGTFDSLYDFVFDLLQISADDVGVTSEIECAA